MQIPILQPTYDPTAVQPMRDELVSAGFVESFTPEDIDQAIDQNGDETTLLMINSVCGCAAGSARPGVTMALQNDLIPDKLVTVFAGQEKEAVEHARQHYLGEFPPSSPAIALFKKGKVISILHRQDIAGKPAEEIAEELKDIFAQFCSRKGPSISPEEYAELKHAVACGSSIPLFNKQ